MSSVYDILLVLRERCGSRRDTHSWLRPTIRGPTNALAETPLSAKFAPVIHRVPIPVRQRDRTSVARPVGMHCPCSLGGSPRTYVYELRSTAWREPSYENGEFLQRRPAAMQGLRGRDCTSPRSPPFPSGCRGAHEVSKCAASLHADCRFEALTERAAAAGSRSSPNPAQRRSGSLRQKAISLSHRQSELSFWSTNCGIDSVGPVLQSHRDR